MPAQRPWLVVVAAPREFEAVLRAPGLGLAGQKPPETWGCVDAERAAIVRSGVGKAAAAGATARWYDPTRHGGVLSVGVGGALPGSGLGIGDAVLADPSVPGDDGVRTPDGFLSLGDIGFGADAAPVHPDGPSRRVLTSLVDRVGPVATVSAGSGTDGLAAEIAARTGAVVEAMEGYACGLAARRIDPDARFAEVRVVSNTTGDRAAQRWDLDAALGRLRALLGPVLDALSD
jgi:futalosine hydrolase